MADEQKQPSEPAYRSIEDCELEREEEEEEMERPRRRIRHYKKEEVMLQECHDFVMAGKRLPKLHSRWIFNRYVNCHNFAVAGIEPHNRMVDELREAHKTIRELQHRAEELQSGKDEQA